MSRPQGAPPSLESVVGPIVRLFLQIQPQGGVQRPHGRTDPMEEPTTDPGKAGPMKDSKHGHKQLTTKVRVKDAAQASSNAGMDDEAP